MVKVTPRTLADWTPDAGDVRTWLERWAAAGWAPEYGWGGSETVVNSRSITRWAMIAAPQVEPKHVDR